jgi:oligopeptide transport system substrate-binding protein
VRRAFSLVIDKQSVVDRITRAGELPADSFVPPGAADYEPYNDCGKRDIAEAKRLLAEAGVPEGKGFPMINYLYSEGELNEAIAVAVD